MEPQKENDLRDKWRKNIDFYSLKVHKLTFLKERSLKINNYVGKGKCRRIDLDVRSSATNSSSSSDALKQKLTNLGTEKGKEYSALKKISSPMPNLIERYMYYKASFDCMVSCGPKVETYVNSLVVLSGKTRVILESSQ